MTRPKKRGPRPTGNAREMRIEIRVNAEEYAAIAAAASADNRTISGWARVRLAEVARAERARA